MRSSCAKLLTHAANFFRRYTMNSLKKFASQQVKLDPTEYLPYTDFLDQYENFCFNRDLHQITDELAIRNFLYV
jgi:hypothetical protein